jgi:hypothetical protein
MRVHCLNALYAGMLLSTLATAWSAGSAPATPPAQMAAGHEAALLQVPWHSWQHSGAQHSQRTLLQRNMPRLRPPSQHQLTAILSRQRAQQGLQLQQLLRECLLQVEHLPWCCGCQLVQQQCQALALLPAAALGCCCRLVPAPGCCQAPGRAQVAACITAALAHGMLLRGCQQLADHQQQ